MRCLRAQIEADPHLYTSSHRNDNEIAYLTGIPPTLRTLLAASNRLTDLTSFQHLSNLERLDISNNQLESVRHLACLRHLRELKADNNRISNLDGLADLDSLVRISLKNNDLSDVDFSRTSWCGGGSDEHALQATNAGSRPAGPASRHCISLETGSQTSVASNACSRFPRSISVSMLSMSACPAQR
ncbi:MAG: leucine-rich repeat domain-containing protein [Microbacterium hominis]|nr:leucine-rich repeat domain-containing protein [Microbacterium hominis]